MRDFLYILWDVPIIMSMLYLNWQVKNDLDNIIAEDPCKYLSDDCKSNPSIVEMMDDYSETRAS